MKNTAILKEPEIRFSAWVPWHNRHTLARTAPCMGVYVWARFGKRLGRIVVHSLILPKS